MDLLRWITNDHVAVRDRIERQVLSIVPHDRWFSADDGPGGTSIAWLLWHTARHQDLSINAVVRGREQIASTSGWAQRVGAAAFAPGVGLSESADRDAAAQLDAEAVAAYYGAVHDETNRWLASIDAAELDRVPNTAATLSGAGITVDAYPWLHRMWADQPVAFHVSWEAIGHAVNHLGEMVHLRNRMGLSPF